MPMWERRVGLWMVWRIGYPGGERIPGRERLRKDDPRSVATMETPVLIGVIGIGKM